MGPSGEYRPGSAWPITRCRSTTSSTSCIFLQIAIERTVRHNALDLRIFERFSLSASSLHRSDLLSTGHPAVGGTESVLLTLATQDVTEGLNAFMEKRAPGRQGGEQGRISSVLRRLTRTDKVASSTSRRHAPTRQG